jgi:hypothetical protein
MPAIGHTTGQLKSSDLLYLEDSLFFFVAAFLVKVI